MVVVVATCLCSSRLLRWPFAEIARSSKPRSGATRGAAYSLAVVHPVAGAQAAVATHRGAHIVQTYTEIVSEAGERIYPRASSDIDQRVLDLCMRQGHLMGTDTGDPLRISID